MPDTGRLPWAYTENWDWQLDAACRDADAGVFFHPENERSRSRSRARREAAAKQLCARCAVRAACLHHALAVREPYGVWGGLTESERWRLLEHCEPGRSGGTAAGAGG